MQNWTPSPNYQQIFDLTNPVATEAAGDGLLSLRTRIISQSNSSTIFKFASKENSNASLRPAISVLTELSPVQMYSKWIDSFPSIPVSDRSQLADPDRDGITNLKEFVHGGNPELIGRSPLTIQYDLYLEFRLRGSLLPQEIISVETTSNPAVDSWSSVSEVVFEEVSAPAANTKLIRAHLPGAATAANRTFFRLNYTLP